MFAQDKNDWRAFFEKSPPIIPGSFDEMWDNTIANMGALKRSSMIQNGKRILDFGCGNGRFGIFLSALPVDYVGVDIHGPSIDFCHSTFAPWKRGEFLHLDVRHRIYNPHGSIAEQFLSLPFPNSSFDSVVAWSVFTHLENSTIAKRCLHEIFRVLRPEGGFFCSWFCSPPNTTTSDPYRTVFQKSDIQVMLAQFEWQGDGGGTTDAMHDQWAIFLKKPKTMKSLLQKNTHSSILAPQ